MLERELAAGRAVAAAQVDIDRFRSVNDRYGVPTGDQLLRQVARRITTTTMDADDTLARIGGDEFVLLCPHQKSTAEATRLAHHVLATLTPVLRLSEAAGVRSGVSIGVPLVGLIPKSEDADGIEEDACHG